MKYMDIKPPKHDWTAHDFAIERWFKSLKSRGGINGNVAVLLIYVPKKPSKSYLIKEPIK